eukprot:g10994.t1
MTGGICQGQSLNLKHDRNFFSLYLFLRSADTLSMYAFRELKLQLAAFLQDRRVKVSLFLQDETQNPDGSIVVPLAGPLPFNTLPPGTVTYLQQDLRQERVEGMVSGGGSFFVNPQRVSRVNPGLHGASWSSLGTNLYAKNQASKQGDKGYASSGGEGPAMSPTQAKRNAVEQLNSLASIYNELSNSNTLALLGAW